MPVVFKKDPYNFEWHFMVKGANGKLICWGAGYNTKTNAVEGSKAAYKELAAWLENQSKSSPKAKPITGRQKPGVTLSTSSRSQTRKPNKRA